MPSARLPNLPDITDPKALEKLELLRQKLSNRPIWSRAALSNVTSLPLHDMKKLLVYVAYTVHTGAFKDCWIRFGVDPRIDPSLYIYQMVNLRNLHTKSRFGKPRRLAYAGTSDLLGVNRLQQQDHVSGETAKYK